MFQLLPLMDQNLCESSTSIVEDEIITGTYYKLAFYFLNM